MVSKLAAFAFISAMEGGGGGGGFGLGGGDTGAGTVPPPEAANVLLPEDADTIVAAVGFALGSGGGDAKPVTHSVSPFTSVPPPALRLEK